jgi:hypothetical protein
MKQEQPGWVLLYTRKVAVAQQIGWVRAKVMLPQAHQVKAKAEKEGNLKLLKGKPKALFSMTTITDSDNADGTGNANAADEQGE